MINYKSSPATGPSSVSSSNNAGAKYLHVLCSSYPWMQCTLPCMCSDEAGEYVSKDIFDHSFPRHFHQHKLARKKAASHVYPTGFFSSRMLPPSKDVAAIEKTTYGAGGVEKVWVLGSQQLSTALSEPRPIYGIRVLHEMNHIKQGTRSCLLCGVQILLKTKL